MSLLTIIGLILLLLRGADGVDAISKSSEEALLKNGFAARILELRASVVPQTDWDDAVTHLDQHFDPEWASANVGTFLTQSSGFELVSVLDSRETQVFGFDRGEPARPALLRALSAQTAPLVAQVRRQEAQRGRFHVTPGNTRMISSPIQAAAVSDVAGAPYVLVATLVQPDFGTALPKGDRAPIVITGEAIDAPFLSLLVQRYRLSEAEIVPASSRANGAKAAVSINDAHGRQLLSLRWRPHRPGDSFLRATLLYIAASLSLGIAALLYFSIAAQRAKESLKRALVVAQDANLAKSEFLASMSHEIRTPLNGVIGGLNLLKSESLTVEGSQLLRNAVDSGEMVNAIINDILDFSKIEAQEMTLASVPTDVDVLLRSVAALFESQCRQKGLQFECQIDSSVEWAELDPLRLKQCLFNLLGNAVKFTREGRVRVVARFEQREQRRVFCVDASDTGIGVSQAAQVTLFQRFKQADGSMSRTFGGSGLGLAITRSLAEMMGGSVRMDSEEGVGSTFYLEVLAPLATRQVAVETLDEVDGPLEGLNILVVDDNSTNLTIASTLLRRLGAKVTTAQSGNEAIKTTLIQTFDLILMDIQMPVMDGMETTRRLRREGGEVGRVPIIALTANALESQKADYLAAGMDAVVSKPISPSLLLAAILQIISSEQEVAVQGDSRSNVLV